jgi:hypothetical protein
MRILIWKEQTNLKNIIKKYKGGGYRSYVKLLCRIESCESKIIIELSLYVPTNAPSLL